MSDCIFCSIVAGDSPAEIVAETDLSIAFRDIHPQAPLHVLVVPREHHRDISDVAAADSALTADLITLSRKVASDAGVTDYRLVFNNGPDAGQIVFHAHGHVLAGGSMGPVFK